MTTNPPTSTAPAALPADGLRDIVGPVDIVSWWDWALRLGLAILVLGALAAALALWWRARQRRLNQPPPPARVIPPHERASRHLEEALRLLADPDRFCTEVSRILRVYLEERFGWNAPDRTTEEFLSELRHHHELAPDLRALLEEFLTRCDLVKFARHDPTEGELRDLHRAALRVVSDTVPAVAVPPPVPAGNPRPEAPRVP